MALDVANRDSGQPFPRFSVCTLVTDKALYSQMMDSFMNAGFVESNTEFIHIDNTSRNVCDAYSGTRLLLGEAKGKYIILCHQDILLNHDNIDRLDECISELDAMDPHWALLGNAGGVDIGTLALRISDFHGRDTSTGNFPVKVQSLDENFILVRKDANIGVSVDMRGFHLHGLDLCISAAIRGYSAYVVDFHVTHFGGGTCDAEFHRCRRAMISKYESFFAGRFVRTTCTEMYLSGISIVNRIMNHRLVMHEMKKYFRRKQP